jgi:hypothetical protein
MPSLVPFFFVVEALHPLPVRVQAFFGGHMVYLATPSGERMLFLLYDRDRWPTARGVWLASEPEYVDDLERHYPVQPVPIDEFTLKGWRMISASSDAFEATIADWVARVHVGDLTLGRMAPPRKRRKRTADSSESF